MSMITLGLDLGISSVGWALIEEDSQKRKIVNWGSRIFEPGVEGTDNEIAAGKGVSRCAGRRLKKALRTQYRRRRDRKKQLLELLIENGFLPEGLDASFFTEVDNRLLMQLPKEDRGQLGHVLPYLYRKFSLDRVLKKDELGRAIYHLAQRRGYLSNRKQELKDQESAGQVKAGINALKEAIKASGSRTLGEYFTKVDPEVERIRSRYTERSMYQHEFRMICQAQREHISEELEEKLFHAIFFQRKLKSCKGLVGKCRLYPERRRCSFAAEEAQLFRIYTLVNNLRIEKDKTIRSLTEDERQGVVDILNGYSDIFNKSGKVALSKLQKAVKLAKGEKFTLGDGEKEICGNVLHAVLYRAFGAKAAGMSADEREKFFNDLRSIEKNEVLLKRLTGYWQLPEEKAADISTVALPDDYCAFSLKALQEMLPDLAAGVDLSTWLKNCASDNSCKEYDLLPLLDSDECPLELRNPIVHRVLTEMRRVVNAIVERYGKPDRIHVELARDLKATNKEREKMTIRMRQREKERAAIAQRIVDETGLEKISRNDILKVMLADECDFTCPYSGKHFSMTELLHGGMVHIEHIIPYSKSFDDSFANKTLCLNELNEQKGSRTPYEAFSGTPEYSAMLERVRHFKGDLAEHKLALFELDKVEPAEFLERNLNDTRYASKLAMQYLAMLYGGMIDKSGKRRVFAISGGCTAMIRRGWGGNYLLGEGEKVRDDHRHHAVDAVTIALTTPSMVQEIARMSSEKRERYREQTRQFIDSAMYEEARIKIDSAAVSHHVVNKMRGALHKETIYSKDYSEGGAVRHERVALAALTAKDIKNIVDKAVKNLILDKLGVSFDYEVTEAMLKSFKDPDLELYMLDRDGNPVNRIKKVRIARTVNTRTIGSGDGRREVANGANYLLAVFARVNEQGEETAWEGEVVSLMDAVQRKQRREAIFEKERPGLRFKFTLQKGDIVKFTKDGEEFLGIVRAFSAEFDKNTHKYQSPRVEMCQINDARKKDDIKASDDWHRYSISKLMLYKMKKYNMNIFGELQTAND